MAYGPGAVGAAAVAGGAVRVLGWAVGGRPETVVFVGVAPLLVLLALVDLAVHRLPDVLTCPWRPAWPPRSVGPPSCRLRRVLAARAAGRGRARRCVPGALPDQSRRHGFGDVKLALALGVALGWYGWGVWAVGAFLGFLLGALYGLTLVLGAPEEAGRRFPSVRSWSPSPQPCAAGRFRA